MPDGMGFRYQPGATDTPLKPGQGHGGGLTTAPQQAIRTLSLRVPQTTSVPGVAPLPLLNARGGGGSDLDMLLTALLKAFGGQGSQRPSGGSPTPPRVRPPIDDPTVDRGPLETVDWSQILRGRNGGNTGIGDTGRGPMGPIGPAPPTIPRPDLPVPPGMPVPGGIEPLF